MQSLKRFPNLKENVHQSIIHSKIYIYIYIYVCMYVCMYKSAQKTYKQPNQLKSNNRHTKKEPHVRIMLLFKFFCFVLFFKKKTLNLTYQRVEVFIYLFNLSPFCEYHHQLETTRASTS